MHILLANVFNSTSQEATRSTSRVKHLFAESRIHDFGHDFGDGSRSIKLTVVTSTLQITQQSFVDIAKQMTVFGYIEINFVQLVHYLTDDGSVFHVVVDTVENITNQDCAFIAGRNINLL